MAARANGSRSIMTKYDRVDAVLDGGERVPRTAFASRPAFSTPPPSFGTVFWNNVRDLPKNEWIVKGVLGTGNLSVLFAPPGSGKTFVALDIAAHVASGLDWCGRAVRGGPAVYLAAEGQQGVFKRVLAQQQRRIDPDEDVRLAIVPKSLDLFNDDGDLPGFVSELHRLADLMGDRLALVVIDTLSCVMADGEENYPSDMGRLIMNMQKIIEATGAHVMMLHHPSKDRPDEMRGHGRLKGSIDTSILLQKDELTGQISAAIRKQKDGEEGPLATISLVAVEIGLDEDGDPITSCVVDAVPAEVETAPKKKRLNDNSQLGLMSLREALATDPRDTPPDAPEAFRAHVPQVVTVDHWRKRFYARKGEQRDNPDTVRKSFLRAQDNLQAINIIRIHNKWVGIIQ
ncbi:MAG: AAA family ATPase [Alphaproteobacteria bacterium]